MKRVELSFLEKVFKSSGVWNSKKARIEELSREELALAEKLASFGLLKIEDGRSLTLTDLIAFMEWFLAQGISVEELVGAMNWKGLERIVFEILTHNGFHAMLNYVLKVGKTRKEIDVVGYKEPYLLLVECKRHKSVSRSQLLEAVRKLKEKALLMCREECFDSILEDYGSWDVVRMVPVVVTWLSPPFKKLEGTPVVPVFAFKSFALSLESLPLKFFPVSRKAEFLIDVGDTA